MDCIKETTINADNYNVKALKIHCLNACNWCLANVVLNGTILDKYGLKDEKNTPSNAMGDSSSRNSAETRYINDPVKFEDLERKEFTYFNELLDYTNHTTDCADDSKAPGNVLFSTTANKARFEDEENSKHSVTINTNDSANLERKEAVDTIPFVCNDISENSTEINVLLENNIDFNCIESLLNTDSTIVNNLLNAEFSINLNDAASIESISEKDETFDTDLEHIQCFEDENAPSEILVTKDIANLKIETSDIHVNDGYNSSDFEFITKEEATECTIIKNRRKKSVKGNKRRKRFDKHINKPGQSMERYNRPERGQSKRTLDNKIDGTSCPKSPRVNRDIVGENKLNLSLDESGPSSYKSSATRPNNDMRNETHTYNNNLAESNPNPSQPRWSYPRLNNNYNRFTAQYYSFLFSGAYAPQTLRYSETKSGEEGNYPLMDIELERLPYRRRRHRLQERNSKEVEEAIEIIVKQYPEENRGRRK